MKIITKITLSLLLVACFTTLGLAKETEKVDMKKACKQAKADLKELQKQLDEVKQEDQQLDSERQKWEEKFQEFQNQLAGKRNCSKGNPHNSPDCERILAGLAETGNQITQIQRQRDPLGPKKLDIENKMFKPQGIIQGYHCQ